jgi:hypothetical protein
MRAQRVTLAPNSAVLSLPPSGPPATLPDALSVWLKLRKKKLYVTQQSAREPVQRDGHLRFIEGPEHARDPERAGRAYRRRARALDAAQQAGLAVPRDLSVVGFDDIPRAAGAMPPLTTIRQAHREKGLLAGHALLGRLRGESVAEHTDLPVQLVVRGSTGRAPQKRS